MPSYMYIAAVHYIKKNGQVCKPGSVLDDHLSRRNISARSSGPLPGQGRAAPLCPPTLLRMGFTQPPRLRDAGELLPRHFTLATALPVSAVCFCCTFPIVTYAGRYHGILALWSPDFPHSYSRRSSHATVWPAQVFSTKSSGRIISVSA